MSKGVSSFRMYEAWLRDFSFLRYVNDGLRGANVGVASKQVMKLLQATSLASILVHAATATHVRFLAVAMVKHLNALACDGASSEFPSSHGRRGAALFAVFCFARVGDMRRSSVCPSLRLPS